MLKNIALTILIAAGASVTLPARAQLTWIDHLNVIDLRTEDSSLDFHYNYPGMGGGPHGWSAPDCLAVVTGPGASFSQEPLEALVERLVVQDGPSVLFPGHGPSPNDLQPETLEQGQIVFPLQDLGTYVTGVRVTTASGESLLEAVEETFGADQLVGLQLLRGCKL